MVEQGQGLFCHEGPPYRVGGRPNLPSGTLPGSTHLAHLRAIALTVEPWNSSLIWRSKSTRRGSLWLSPIGFLCRFGRKWSETLGFPGFWRKCHAETTESSGKSGLGGCPRRGGLRRRPGPPHLRLQFPLGPTTWEHLPSTEDLPGPRPLSALALEGQNRPPRRRSLSC